MDIISGGQHAENIVSNFNDVLLECNLLDTSRLFHPESKEYTWSKTNLSVARRLDYILTSSDIFDKTGERSVFSVSTSDQRDAQVRVTGNLTTRYCKTVFLYIK